jgi:DNA-binding NtrC family response regulator
VRRNRGDDTVALSTGQAGTANAAWLIIAPGTADERKYPVRERPLCIGKDPAAEICLTDQTVSRRHAEVRRTSDGVQIRDLGSLNGTHVEGVAVQEAVLRTGAMITVGQTSIRFELASATGARAAASPPPIPAAAATPRFGAAVGKSEVMRQVFALLARIAPSDLTVTLIGETGTGKDILARAVHDASGRRAGPFVVFDAGAVAPTLIESELFGHEKGAFTGAVSEHAGVFERASGGTVFLDEIGELALDLQPKLLRVLEQRQVTRIGGGEPRAVDVRIIAATNRDLEAEVRAGRFREDLYFRLSAAVVRVPALRERRDDIAELVEMFTSELTPRLKVSPEALAVLSSYDWPGNVRELKNVLAGAAAVADRPLLEPRDFILFQRRQREPTLDKLPLAGRTLESIERATIRQTLEKFGGNKTKTAKALGIAASTLYEKIKKYDL